MDTKATHTKHSGHHRYAPGTSRGRHSATTLLAQVADIERGQRIKALREGLHLTQPAVVDLLEEAAKRLPEGHDLHPSKAGKAPVTLRGFQTYERGGGIVWEKAKLLAQVLQTDVQAMMHGTPEDTPTPDPFATAAPALAEQLGAIDKRLANIEQGLSAPSESDEPRSVSAEVVRAVLESLRAEGWTLAPPPKAPKSAPKRNPPASD